MTNVLRYRKCFFYSFFRLDNMRKLWYIYLNEFFIWDMQNETL